MAGRTARRARNAASAGPRRTPRADPVRRAVCDVLLAVATRGAYANLLLPSVLRDRQLSGRDAALATELCYGTLRGQGSYDAILNACSDRPVVKMDPPVREVLRLGVHQLLGTRIAAHAAVATSVDLAKDVAGSRTAGFVNAVLRRVSTRDLEAWVTAVAPDRRADPAGYLAVRHSYPGWIVAAFREALAEDPHQAPEAPLAGVEDESARAAARTALAGVEDESAGAAARTALAETEAALAAGNVAPRVTLCALPGRSEPGELAGTAGCEPARWSPFGVYLAHGDPASIPAVRERRAIVQDEASQLAALALSRAEVTGPDRLWLDMCAGPGGKAGLLAGLAAARGARLLASDVREHRASLAADALAGVPSAATVAADGTAPAWRPAAFDRVLADVPCSGLGSLRRRPESRWRRSPRQLTELARLQRTLLATAIDSVRPGGVVGYVTCSPHVAETRDVLAAVLDGRQDTEVLDAPALLAGVAGLSCPAPFGKYAQFWSHRHGTDAIFLAVIRRLA
ncbi:MAG TPA: transcription antitermination factor NusB [Streptosporangiaceae bacterium]